MGVKSFIALSSRKFMLDFFKTYPQHIEFMPEKKKMAPITSIIQAFHEDLINTVIEERHGAELPLSMGAISIVAYKKHRAYPNFPNYNKTGVMTDHSNIHSGGLACKIYYTNRSNRYKLKNRILWEFLPERKFKRRVSKVFGDNYHNYVYSPDIYKIFNTKIDSIFTGKMMNRIEKFLETYDEFAF